MIYVQKGASYSDVAFTFFVGNYQHADPYNTLTTQNTQLTNKFLSLSRLFT